MLMSLLLFFVVDVSVVLVALAVSYDLSAVVGVCCRESCFNLLWLLWLLLLYRCRW